MRLLNSIYRIAIILTWSLKISLPNGTALDLIGFISVSALSTFSSYDSESTDFLLVLELAFIVLALTFASVI
jgi:hypothetical protein